MKRLTIAILLLAFPAVLQAAVSAPVALLFPVSEGESAGSSYAVETTQAIKTYMRQIGKADITDFDPDSPLIKRAVMEHRIKAEDLGTASTPEARINLGSRIGTDYVISGDVMVKEDKVTVSVWIAQTETKKIMRFEATSGFLLNGNRGRAISNSIQSAASTVLYQLADEALKDVKVDPVEPQQTIVDDTPLIDPPNPSSSRYEEAGSLVNKAEEFVKKGDLANAILVYRQAVNADPRNVDLRIRLIRLYMQRKMFTQALDEIERAQLIAPNNEALRTELAKVHEARGTPEKAAEIYTSVAEENPNDIIARIRAGDYQWQQDKLDEAEKQYRLAAQIDVTSPLPYERLALLYAVKSMYAESRDELDQAKKVSSKAELKTFSDSYYTRFLSIIDADLTRCLSQLEQGADSFSRRDITREAYYEQVRGISSRVQLIARLLQALNPPESQESTHRHKSLGCSLVSQSCASALGYLETNKTSEKDDATIYLTEARKHILAR